jgi:hypothetical protein
VAVCCCNDSRSSFEQPRVLDRDDGLLRKIAQKFDLLVREGLDLLPVDINRADQRAFLEHRHDDERTSAAEVGEGHDCRVARAVRWHCSNVLDMHRPFSPDDLGMTA